MNTKRGWTLVLAAVVVLAGLPSIGAARPAAAGAAIEPELLARLQAEGQANFFVKMTGEANLSAARLIRQRRARAEFVWDLLNKVAQTSQAPVLSYARAHGLDYRSVLANNSVFVRGGSLAAAQDLAALPGVANLRLERIYPVEKPLPAAGDPSGAVSWGLIDSGATQLWDLGVRGAGAWVASIDTGVQWDHPALISSYGCPDNPGDPRCWWDPSNICGGVPCDNNGHGTHVMGTMVADDNPSFPYTAGMAPDASWIACKGCESSGCSEGALTACADWSVAPGGDPANAPDVVNNSWGGMGCDGWFMPWVDAWQATGIFPSFAAGGSGPECASLGSPADYLESFATTGHDISRNIAPFAGRGPSCFGVSTKPNLSSPAINICSTVPTDSWSCWSGTSMAAAHTSGAVALLVAGCPELADDMPLLWATLQDYADTPPDGNCGAPPGGDGNYTYGHGYLNALAAVESCRVANSLHLNRMKLNWAVGRPGVYKVIGTVRIHDQDHAVVPDVTVAGEWTLPNGAVVDQEALTTILGQAKLRLKSAQCGLFELCVTGLAKPGYGYDPAADEAPECMSIQAGCSGTTTGEP